MSTRIVSLALFAGLVGVPAVAVADSRPVAAEVQRIQAPAPASSQDTTDYAQREAQDKKAAEFQGGNTVIVMSGTALVVLVLLLLLI
jgi:hypothetical protein